MLKINTCLKLIKLIKINSCYFNLLYHHRIA